MHLFRILLVLFLTVPLVEIYLLLKIGGVIGVFPTVVLVVGTAMLGAWMLRKQGLSTLKRLQDTLSRNEIPAREIFEGPLLLVGGALLLTPGFVTDAMGFYLLIPVTRSRLVRYLLENRPDIQGLRVGGGVRHPESAKGTTIEGDFTRED